MKIPNDYKLIEKYDIMKVCNVEILFVPINEGNQIKYYVYSMHFLIFFLKLIYLSGTEVVIE